MAFNNSQREFIGRLNTILPAAEAAKEPPESFNYEAELAMFTNTEFFDFDVGHSTDFQHPAFPFNATSGADQKPLEYLAGKCGLPLGFLSPSPGVVCCAHLIPTPTPPFSAMGCAHVRLGCRSFKNSLPHSPQPHATLLADTLWVCRPNHATSRDSLSLAFQKI
jgi:hypothetical protein